MGCCFLEILLNMLFDGVGIVGKQSVCTVPGRAEDDGGEELGQVSMCRRREACL